MAGRRFLALLLAVIGAAPAAEAQGFLERTWLLDVRQGSARSAAVRAAEGRSLELADGTRIGFDQWYGTRWPDLHVSFLTQISDSVGIVWGFSTGERGEKYRIDPGLKLGLLVSLEPAPSLSVAFGLTMQVGSSLSERDCVADYGEFGGGHRVNCRLAGSALPPGDTLGYRLRGSGLDDSRVTLRLEYRF